MFPFSTGLLWIIYAIGILICYKAKSRNNILFYKCGVAFLGLLLFSDLSGLILHFLPSGIRLFINPILGFLGLGAFVIFIIGFYESYVAERF